MQLQTSDKTGKRWMALGVAAVSALLATVVFLLAMDGAGIRTAQAATFSTTTVCLNQPYTIVTTTLNANCVVPRFNPSLGTLSRVVLTMTTSMSGTMQVEDLDPAVPVTYNGTLTSTTLVNTSPTTPTVLLSSTTLTNATASLAQYDGVLDFGGTSGRTFAGTQNQTSAISITTNLGQWIGATGSVTHPVQTTSRYQCVVSPAVTNLACGSLVRVSTLMTVTYIYDTPEISVTKSHTGNFAVGQNGLYTISVSNVGTGPTLGPITVTDQLPLGLSYVSHSGTGWSLFAQSGQVVTFTRSTAVNAGASAPGLVLTVGVTNTAIGTITNTVSVTTTRDITTTNNIATDATLVRPSANLGITKSDSADPVNASQPLSYTITVSNSGPSTAPTVTVTDTLPAGFVFGSVSGSGWSCSGSGPVVCSRTNLASGATAPNIVIVGTAPANGGVITNTAVVGTDAVDAITANNTTSITTTVNAVADLGITKADTPDPVFAGNTLTYTLSVTNSGPSIAAQVTVTDTLPVGFTFGGATGTGWTLTQAGGVVTATRTNAAVGALPAVVITGTAPVSGPITNTARVSTTAIDQNAANNLATASTAVTANANLSIAKSAHADAVVVNDLITYTLNITNSGPNTANNVIVTDTLPASVTFGSVNGAGWTCGRSGVTVTCTVASLAVGAANPISIIVTAPGTASTITNTATVASAVADLVTSNNTASVVTTIAAAISDLQLTKTDTPDPVNAGGALTYTLSINNNGPNATNNVIVTDTLPASYVFGGVSGSGWACGRSGVTVTCTVASLNVGSAPNIIITGTAPASGPITNTAVIASAVADTNTGNNTSSAITTISPVSDLALTKSDTVDPATAGANFAYTLAITNAGPSTAPTVTVTDSLPAGVTFVGASGAGWSITQASGLITATRSNAAVGALPSIIITVTAPAEATGLTNTAGVSTTALDQNTANDFDTETTTVTASANLAITKVDTPDPVDAAGMLTYTVRVTNTGPSTAANITVSDTLPAALTNLAVSGPGWDNCSFAGSLLTCSLTSLSVGGAPVIVVTGQAPNNATTLNNTATVSASTADPNSANNTSGTVSTTVRAVADLSVSKTNDPNPVAPNSLITYTISVTNSGPSPAATVRVTDTLPANVTFGGVSGAGWTCGRSGQTVTCTVASLAVATAPNIIITGTTSAFGGNIINNVSVGATTFDPNTANNSAQSTATVTTPDVSISKTNGQSTVVPGMAVTYTIVVTNSGPGALNNVTVTDIFPGIIGGVTWTCSATGGSSCPANGSGNINTMLTLQNGGVATFTAGGLVNATATGSLSNVASVSIPGGDAIAANNIFTDTDPLTPQIDLVVASTDNPDPVLIGNFLQYRITVTNTGPSQATGVTVIDNLPASFNYELDTAGCNVVGQQLTCALGTMTVGAVRNINIFVTPTAAGVFTNTTDVNANEVDTNPSNNSAPQTTTVNPVALALSLMDAPDPVNAGGTLTYTLAVTNSGPASASGVTITTTLPVSATFNAAQSSAGCTEPTTGTVVCVVGALGVNATAQAQVAVTVASDTPDGSQLNVSSVVAANEPETNTSDNVANASTTVVNVVILTDLGISKTNGVSSVTAGTPVTYTIVVTNAGPTAVSGATVTDILPAALTNAAWTCVAAIGNSCPASGSGNINASVDLAAGGRITFTVSALVASSATGNLSNTASVAPPAGIVDSNSSNNSTTDTDSVTVSSDLKLSVIPTPNPVTPGGAVTYNIVVTNTGPSDSSGVTLNYLVPNGLTLNTASGSGWDCQQSGNQVACTRTTIASGTTAPLTFTLTAPASSGDVSNTISVSAASDSNTADNSVTFTLTVAPYQLFLPLISRQ
jgi:uncharacterized repeat protein (TIGR01451 family)